MIGEISKLDCNLKALNHEINAYLIKTNTCFSLTNQNKTIIIVSRTLLSCVNYDKILSITIFST